MEREFWFMGRHVYLNLLYLPYTFLSLSYALAGWVLAGMSHPYAALVLLAALFAGHGLSAHLINAHYRGPSRRGKNLLVLGVVSLAASVVLGVYALRLSFSYPLIAVGIAEIIIVIGYSHPLTGFLHNIFTVCAGVGLLPALAGYLVSSDAIRPPAIGISALCFFIVLFEIIPSRSIKSWRRTPARGIRVTLNDGSERLMSVEEVVRAEEDVIKAMLALSYALPIIVYLLGFSGA